MMLFADKTVALGGLDACHISPRLASPINRLDLCDAAFPCLAVVRASKRLLLAAPLRRTKKGKVT
jgi:hypothetical protein